MAGERVETNRPPASAFLLIDSNDRDQRSTEFDELTDDAVWPQPLNNFVIQKRQTFVSGYFHRIAVTECRFEYAVPNINERNNKIEIAVPRGNTSTTVITIDEGYYTPTELAAALETKLQAAFAGEDFQVSYSSAQSAFNIDNTGGTEPDFQLIPFKYLTLEQTKRGLYFMMNWGDGQGVLSNQNDDQWGLPGPSMMYTRYIDICSSKLTQYQNVKDNSTRESQSPTVLVRLYIGNYTSECVGDGNTSANLSWPGCRPTVIQRIFNVPKYSNWSPGQFLDAVDIELRDDAGNLLYVPGDFPEGINYCANAFQLTLHCSES